MATYYIWPGAAFNGDGSLRTKATTGGGPGAFNTIPTLTANNNYGIRQGTTHSGQIRVTSIDSADTTPMTFFAYGYDDSDSFDPAQEKPIFKYASIGDGVLWADRSDNVVFRNLAATSPTGGVVDIACAGLRTRNASRVRFYDCDSYANAYGAYIDTGTGANGGNVDDLLLDGCRLFKNLANGIEYRFGILADGANNRQMRNFKVKFCQIFGNGFTSNSNYRRAGFTHRCDAADVAGDPLSHTPAYGCLDMVVEDNVIFDNYGYALAVYSTHPDKRRPSFRRNKVYENGRAEDRDAHPFWIGGSRDCDIADNLIFDNKGDLDGSIGTAVGIFIDFNGNGSAVQPTGGGHKIYGNRLFNGWTGRTLSTLPSSAIHVLSNESCQVFNNLVVNWRNGLTNQGTGSNNNTYEFNTVVGIVDKNAAANSGGHGMTITVGTGIVVRYNIFSNCVIGIHADTGITPTEDYNVLHNCATQRTRGSVTAPITTGITWNGANDVTTNPQLDSFYRPTASSPSIGVLAQTRYISDASGLLRRNPLTHGAFDYRRVRTATSGRLRRNFF